MYRKYIATCPSCFKNTCVYNIYVHIHVHTYSLWRRPDSVRMENTHIRLRQAQGDAARVDQAAEGQGPELAGQSYALDLLFYTFHRSIVVGFVCVFCVGGDWDSYIYVCCHVHPQHTHTPRRRGTNLPTTKAAAAAALAATPLGPRRRRRRWRTWKWACAASASRVSDGKRRGSDDG